MTARLAADRARALSLIPVSHETVAKLDRYVETLLVWQSKTNLIAPSTIPELWTRHIADSLQLLALAPTAQTWLDIGSGGGFPGLVIGCALPDTGIVHLVESNLKKAAFLREAARISGASAKVHAARIEEVVDEFAGTVDIVSARAVAPLAKLLQQAYPLLKGGAKGLFLKGQDVAAELTEAAKYWIVEADLVQSATDKHGCIVVLQGIKKRSENPV